MIFKAFIKLILSLIKDNFKYILIALAIIFVINGGPIIAVKLIKLDKAPCNSPCSFLGTWEEITDCKAGPAIPPKP